MAQPICYDLPDGKTTFKPGDEIKTKGTGSAVNTSTGETVIIENWIYKY